MRNEITYQTFIKSYWNYFIELEEQLISTKRFIAFDKVNNKTFSIEYLKLLQATCSEIDVVAKIIAQYFDEKVKYKTIQQWGFTIQNAFPEIENISVVFNDEETLKPWEKWKYEEYLDKKGHMRYRLAKNCKTPQWWTAYNKVKHERTTYYDGEKTNYMRANQGNLILAMAALFILEDKFIAVLSDDDKRISHTESRLFRIV